MVKRAAVILMGLCLNASEKDRDNPIDPRYNLPKRQSQRSKKPALRRSYELTPAEVEAIRRELIRLHMMEGPHCDSDDEKSEKQP